MRGGAYSLRKPYGWGEAASPCAHFFKMGKAGSKLLLDFGLNQPLMSECKHSIATKLLSAEQCGDLEKAVGT